MSNPIHTSILLPAFILEYVPDRAAPKIDSELFLTKATTPEILHVILAFHPHFQFPQHAKEDRELLRSIFIELVAARLSNLVVPVDFNTKYIQIPFQGPISEPQESPKQVNSIADINADRTEWFNQSVLGYLTIGKYRLAAEHPNSFIEKYKYLKREEIEYIATAQTHAEDFLHDTLRSLKDAHCSIESIQLLARQSRLTNTEREELDEKLRGAIAALRSNQKMLNCAVEDVSFLEALNDYHYKILLKHHSGTQNPSSTSDNKEDSSDHC